MWVAEERSNNVYNQMGETKLVRTDPSPKKLFIKN